LSKWVEYTLAVFFVSMVAAMMYGSHYAHLLEEADRYEYYDDGCAGLIFRPSVAL